MGNYAYGLFTVALAFISFFIMVYAYLFMAKTAEHKDRRPWDFLFVASILFFIFEIASLLSYLRLISFVGLDMDFVGKLFEFLYGGLVLLAFISQHDLIMRSHLILISKREKNDGETAEPKTGAKPPMETRAAPPFAFEQAPIAPIVRAPHSREGPRATRRR